MKFILSFDEVGQEHVISYAAFCYSLALWDCLFCFCCLVLFEFVGGEGGADGRRICTACTDATTLNSVCINGVHSLSLTMPAGYSNFKRCCSVGCTFSLSAYVCIHDA